VKRLARETTNDNGEPLNVATANILLLEFKKYLFLCAIRIAHDTTNKFQKFSKSGFIFTAPFPAPPMIQKAWDMIILYSDSYIALCNLIFNDFLNKPSFASEQEEFEGYDYMYRFLNRKRRLLHPFWNFWPKYAKKEFYFKEKNLMLSERWLSNNQKSLAYQFVQNEVFIMKETGAIKDS